MKAIDTWTAGCYFTVFAALAEYCLILYLTQRAIWEKKVRTHFKVRLNTRLGLHSKALSKVTAEEKVFRRRDALMARNGNGSQVQPQQEVKNEKLGQFLSKRKREVRMDGLHEHFYVSNFSFLPQPVITKNGEEIRRKEMLAARIEFASRIILPLYFAGFNLIFWIAVTV